MKNFSYFRPRTAEQAVGLLDAKWGTSELLAGGTDLVSLQKEYVAQPDKVISLAGLPASFRSITVLAKDPAILVLGAGVKLAELAASADVKKHAPALAGAADEIAGPQIRNMGTLGGSLCQRNRCWYFRDEHTHCLLKGGDKCFALDGENRYHAVFTRGNPCVIVHPSTLAPVLIALNATADVLGPKGTRSLELSKFFRAPKGPGEREHVLEANEMVTAVRVPVVKNGRSASYEVRQRLAIDWPTVQATAAFQLDGGKATNVKVVLGHVAPTPHVAEAAAKAIEGKEVTEATAAAAGKAATEGARPLAQNGYKLRLIEVAVKRALLSAAGVKKYWEA
jgi:xanthine dehydrogenase YagS FAD-binding subunit